MTRTSRKRKLETIVLSGSEGEQPTCSHSQVTPAWTYEFVLTLGCRELTSPIAAYSQQHGSRCSYRNLRAMRPDPESLPLQVLHPSLLVPGVQQLTLLVRHRISRKSRLLPYLAFLQSPGCCRHAHPNHLQNWQSRKRKLERLRTGCLHIMGLVCCCYQVLFCSCQLPL